MRRLRTLAILAATLVSLLTSSLATATPIAPAITRSHNAVDRTVTVTNRARLLAAHRGATVTYQWQVKRHGRWASVRGAHHPTFVVPSRFTHNAVRLLVTFTTRRSHRSLASNPSPFVPAAAAELAAPSVSVGPLPSPYIPASWSGPNPPRNCGVPAEDDGRGDTNSALITLDYCGATLEGLAPLTLPSNWAVLSDTQRGFVLLNLERIARGETPFNGESTTLDGYAMQGAEANTDPNPPDNADWYGSNWFGGTDSTDAVAGYVFDDGPGSGNLACSGGTTSGCWGHRDNILENAAEPNLAAGLADGSNGDSTEIFGYDYTDFDFTWATEVAAGYPQGLPASFTLTPAAITQIVANPDGTITVTGRNLDTVTGVWFAGVLDRKVWSCSTPTSCSIAPPDGLRANTTYGVFLVNPAGLSAATPAARYTTGP